MCNFVAELFRRVMNARAIFLTIAYCFTIYKYIHIYTYVCTKTSVEQNSERCETDKNVFVFYFLVVLVIVLVDDTKDPENIKRNSIRERA